MAPVNQCQAHGGAARSVDLTYTPHGVVTSWGGVGEEALPRGRFPNLFWIMKPLNSDENIPERNVCRPTLWHTISGGWGTKFNNPRNSCIDPFRIHTLQVKDLWKRKIWIPTLYLLSFFCVIYFIYPRLDGVMSISYFEVQGTYSYRCL